jgi:hypothetical protein
MLLDLIEMEKLKLKSFFIISTESYLQAYHRKEAKLYEIMMHLK